jgi:hypothetical protein
MGMKLAAARQSAGIAVCSGRKIRLQPLKKPHFLKNQAKNLKNFGGRSFI